jgi:pyridoxamine 5'-phosphate oxidase family protein
MSRFTPEEIAYLGSQRLGRLATLGQKGDLHVVPVSFRYNPEHDTIDIGGHNIVPTKKYRDALRHGRVAFVVDDVLPPWQPRMVEIRGTVESLAEGGREIGPSFSPEILRITPTYIVSLGLIEPPNPARDHIQGREVE